MTIVSLSLAVRCCYNELYQYGYQMSKCFGERQKKIFCIHKSYIFDMFFKGLGLKKFPVSTGNFFFNSFCFLFFNPCFILASFALSMVLLVY